MNLLNKILEEYNISTQELAEKSGLTDARIRQLAPLMEKKGHSLKVCGPWRFKESAITWVNNRHLHF